MRIGRGDKIRTCDHFHPKEVRYQAALRPDARLETAETAGARSVTNGALDETAKPTRGTGAAAIRVRRAGAGSVRRDQIGRASCGERVGRYVWISVVAVTLKKKT